MSLLYTNTVEGIKQVYLPAQCNPYSDEKELIGLLDSTTTGFYEFVNYRSYMLDLDHIQQLMDYMDYLNKALGL